MTELTTTIIAVTVFPDRARVTRAGRVSVQPGVQKLEVSQLPLALVADSVRASGQGTARAKLLGVSTRLEQFTETPAASALELEQKIQAGQDIDSELLARIAVLEKEQKALDGLAAQSEMFARGLSLRNRSLEEQGSIFTFLTDRSHALQTEILKTNRERRELAKELDRLRRDLNQTQSARPKQRYVATAEVEVSAAGELEIELTYVVQRAQWKPLYDLRLNGNTLDITYLAQVAQDTGEEWKDVALTLSTAQPALALVMPELEPWYIRPAPPVMRVAPAPKRAMLPSIPLPAAAPAPQMFQATTGAAPEAEQYLEMEADTAAVSESGASLTYKLPARADIPGNNDPRKVTVAIFGLRPDLDYVTAPKREPVCYRRATIKNDSPYTLLPGSAQLFEGDEYLGATELEFVAPNQKFELALGADERVRAERKLEKREEDKASLLGDRKRIRYAYSITVENLRDTAQVIFVRDQLPVARDEQIKIKLDSADPKPSEQSELNLLEWKLTLDKNAKQTVRFDYSVDFLKAVEVIGLPE